MSQIPPSAWMNRWGAKGKCSPRGGLLLDSLGILKEQPCRRTACSGLAHPHFGLSLCFGLHGQRVLQPGWQPHILTERERAWVGRCAALLLAAGAFVQTCHLLCCHFMTHSESWFSSVCGPWPLRRQWAGKSSFRAVPQRLIFLITDAIVELWFSLYKWNKFCVDILRTFSHLKFNLNPGC